MQLIAILLFWSLSHPFLSLLVVMTVVILAALVAISATVGVIPIAGKAIRRAMGILALAVGLTWFFNFFMGHFLRNPIVYHFGERGEGLVVAVTSTSSTYNDQPVLRHEVMIRPVSATESPISTYFETSDFNIHPHSFSGSYSYPSTGTRFSVRYLPSYPRAMVISSVDESEYTRGLRISERNQIIAKLRQQLSMDPGNMEYKRNLAQCLEDSLREQGAPESSKDALQREITALRK